MKKKNNTPLIVVSIIIGLVGLYFYFSTSLESSPNNPANFSKERYLAEAVKKCNADGTQEAYCACTYGALVDKYGVKATYEMDLAYASTQKVDDRIMEESKGCLVNE